MICQKILAALFGQPNLRPISREQFLSQLTSLSLPDTLRTFGENMNCKKNLKIIYTLSFLLLSLSAKAKSESTTKESIKAPKTPEGIQTFKSPEPTTERSKNWSIVGNFDFYYAFNSNSPSDISGPTANSTSLPAGNNSYRFYDSYARQFSLNLAELSLKHTTKEVSFLLDLDFGQMAELNAVTPPNLAVDNSSKNIGQAIVTFTPEGAPTWTFDIGKMPTHLGLEVIKAKENWNYSRSFLFTYGIPVWHTGVHANYAANSQLNFGAYLYNGWNTLYSINSAQTFGWQVKFVPNESLTLIYNGISGPQKAADVNDKKTVHEANFTYLLNLKFALGFDFLVGSEDRGVSATVDTKWTAYSIALKYQIDEKSYTSFRYESFKDENGKIVDSTLAQNLNSATVTYAYRTSTDIEARIEYRRDNSDKTVFVKGDGSSVDNQSTATLALLYSI